MKVIALRAAGNQNFYEIIKGASKCIESVFRDHNGFVAVCNGVEAKITPTPNSKFAYDLFFHGNEFLFEGSVNVPDENDFGVEKASEQKVAEQPAFEAPAAASETSVKETREPVTDAFPDK